MENKEQDRALQPPSEANRDKHMNYPEESDSSETDNHAEETRRKHNTGSDNDSTNEILQKEKLIDPGNEHTDRGGDNSKSPRYDADSGGDAAGTMGPKPE